MYLEYLYLMSSFCSIKTCFISEAKNFYNASFKFGKDMFIDSNDLNVLREKLINQSVRFSGTTFKKVIEAITWRCFVKRLSLHKNEVYH